MARRKISASAARRIALAAHHIHRPRPGCSVNAGHISRTISRLGLLQLDYVNVLVPAHLMVLFSRLGPFDLGRFHKAVYGGGGFTEQWAHEASIVPCELWPLLEHRREDYRPWPNSPIMKIKGRSKYLSEVIENVKEKGALTASELPQAERPKRKPGDWNRSLPRWALECHFGNGDLAVANRLPNFQRVYDLPENVIPAPHLESRVDRTDAERELLRRSAVRCGIGTLQDFADYYRMSPRVAAPRLAELLDAGDVEQVEVEGWRDPAYLARDAHRPRRIACSRLLSPFDPIVWFRPRAERLFDFEYRIEIYVPAAKRRWGYYVLPFLEGDRITARVDLKADRKASRLLVLSSHPEPGIDREVTSAALARELRLLADWLSLETIGVARKGKLARELGAAVRSL